MTEVRVLCIPLKINDGGGRDAGARATCSSAAWVVEMISWQTDQQKWHTQVLAFSATYINCWVSSFTAESLALQQASDFIVMFVRKLCSSGVVGKIDVQ